MPIKAIQQNRIGHDYAIWQRDIILDVSSITKMKSTVTSKLIKEKACRFFSQSRSR